MDIDGISAQVIATLIAAALVGIGAAIWRFEPLRRLRLRSPLYIKSALREPGRAPAVQAPEPAPIQAAPEPQRNEAAIRQRIKEKLRSYRDDLRHDGLYMLDEEERRGLYQEIADYIEDNLGKDERITFWNDAIADGITPDEARAIRVGDLLARIDDVPIRPYANP